MRYDYSSCERHARHVCCIFTGYQEPWDSSGNLCRYVCVGWYVVCIWLAYFCQWWILSQRRYLGVYFTLFFIALFSTLQRNARTMRIVTIALWVSRSYLTLDDYSYRLYHRFIVNLTHLISRSFDMNEARRIPQPVLAEELYRWTIPLRVVETWVTRHIHLQYTNDLFILSMTVVSVQP